MKATETKFKTLLINMPVRMNAPPNVIPTGIGILANILESEGFRCDVIDLNVYRPVKTSNEIKILLDSIDRDYDLIGLSGMITTLKWQKIIAGMVRTRWPDSCIASGGGLASDFGKTLFEWIPELNVVVVGEGEPHILEIINNLENYRRKTKVFEPRYIENLDFLPGVAWSKFDLETYLHNDIWGKDAQNSSWTSFKMNRSINLISSRGCPYNCNFCDRMTTGGRNYRSSTAERLISDVTDVIELHNVDFIAFLDDNFLTDKNRLKKFLPMIEKMEIAWGCHGRLNDIKEDTAYRLREAGCLYIGFGGESADNSILNRMNKQNNPRQMAKAVGDCKKAGITANCTWIMGYPGETRETLRRTTKFILENELSQRSMFVATAYPGTQFFNEVKGKILSHYETLEDYVVELDDATKIIMNKNGILNYSDMSDEEFMECKGYVESGALEKI